MNHIPDTLIQCSPHLNYGIYKSRKDQDPVLISETDYNKAKVFVDAMPNIYLFRNTFYRLAQVEMNLQTFENAFNGKLTEQLEILPRLQFVDETDLELVNLIRLCNNFCFSFFNIIELMKKQIIEEYGEDSSYYNNWKNMESGHYDNFFEYRLVKQLRHFTHLDSPIAGIFEDDNNIKHIVFQKNRFQKMKQFKGKAFNNDWQKLSKSFSAEPILIKSLEYLKSVVFEYLKINKDLIFKSADSIINNFGEFNKREILIGERKKEGINSLQLIPQRISKSIMDYYNNDK